MNNILQTLLQDDSLSSSTKRFPYLHATDVTQDIAPGCLCVKAVSIDMGVRDHTKAHAILSDFEVTPGPSTREFGEVRLVLKRSDCTTNIDVGNYVLVSSQLMQLLEAHQPAGFDSGCYVVLPLTTQVRNCEFETIPHCLSRWEAEAKGNIASAFRRMSECLGENYRIAWLRDHRPVEPIPA